MPAKKDGAASLSTRLFDPKLYVEGLRQLRVMGVLCSVILEVVVLLCCYNSALYQSVDFEATSFLILLGVMAMTLLMTLYLFRFLNHRESCDFYHALPHTRTSLFLSLLSAVLTWALAGFFLTAATALIGTDIPTGYPVVFRLLFGPAAILFLAAVTALAMNVTGTTLSNVLVTGMFALAPRLLVMVYLYAAQSILPILPVRSESVFDLHYNPIFYLLEHPGGIWEDYGAVLYALAVGLLYTVLALFLFRRRRSETAGRAAPNRILQTAFRLLLSMLICLYPCTRIVQGYFRDGDDLLLLIFYAAALIVYFLYELLTTRKMKNLVKSIPALGVLLAMNIVFVASLSGLKAAVFSQTPDAEEVQSVTFRLNNSGTGYLEARAESISIENKDCLYLVTERLRKEAATLQKTPGYAFGYPNFVSTTREVEIRTKSGVIHRVLPFTPAEYTQISQWLRQEDAYQRAYMELPSIRSADVNVHLDGLSDSQTAAVYQQLQQEINELGLERWYNIVNNPRHYVSLLSEQGDGDLYFSNLYLSGPVNGEWRTTTITLSTALPRTLALYLKSVNESNWQAVLEGIPDEDAAIHTIGVGISEESGYIEFYINQFSKPEETAVRAFLTELVRRLEADPGQTVDVTKPLYGISVSRGGEESMVYLNVEEGTYPPTDLDGILYPGETEYTAATIS